MYRMPCRLSVVALILMVAACSKSNETVKPQAPPTPPKETVFDDLISNKERAKQDTERAMEQNRAKNEAALKESEGSTAP